MSTTTAARLDFKRRALAAEEKIRSSRNGKESLEAAITAAESYMRALKLAQSSSDKNRLDAKTKELLAQAEKLKTANEDNNGSGHGGKNGTGALEYPKSTRQPTKREQIIILEGSKLNGAIFKPWTVPPAEHEFKLQNGQELFTDEYDFLLSESQLKHFAGWQRPKDALARIQIKKDGADLPNEATMEKLGIWDMVQDAAPDCSVVASFCVGLARVERGHKKLHGNTLFPNDASVDFPTFSENGRYVLRLYFNGSWRRVDIDDRLPTSTSSRILHVIDRSHPGLLWPALIEKAYLKVRGGYNFPGSNSSTDIAVLTGWIPQQIFLHDNEVVTDTLWDELFSAFHSGEILCTLGTGKLGRREQQQLGLGAEHDYAILDMKDDGSVREMLIKNPWADGDVWKGATRCRPNPGHEKDAPQSAFDDTTSKVMKPGTFWMDFNHVFQYFENLYLNRDPRLFKHREDIHFSWHIPDVCEAGNLFADHPQFAVRTNDAGEIWILLNRHFRTGDFSVENHGKNGYISLYLFENDGGRVFSSESAKVRGPFVDSPNTLLRFQAKPRQSYTVAAAGQELPIGKHNFTLSALSYRPLVLEEAHRYHQAQISLSAAWTRSTAGGNSESPEYLQNPQFTIRVGHEARTVLVLKALSDGSSTKLNSEIHVKTLITSSNGGRITKLRQRDIIAQSGDYKRGSAVIETTLPPGIYTVVCSTFDSGQLAKFTIDLYTTLETRDITFTALAAEGSGRFSIMTPPIVFADGINKMIAKIELSRVTKALWKASLKSGPGSVMLNMSLMQGQGPYERTIASSSIDGNEFAPIGSGLRMEDVDLSSSLALPLNGGLWLVLQRPPSTTESSESTTHIQVEALSEEKFEIGAWVPVEDQL